MQADSLITVLQGKGLKPFNYSGRGMYGRRCIAVELESLADIVRLGVELSEGLVIDHLALRFVAYWPDALVGR